MSHSTVLPGFAEANPDLPPLRVSQVLLTCTDCHCQYPFVHREGAAICPGCQGWTFTAELVGVACPDCHAEVDLVGTHG